MGKQLARVTRNNFHALPGWLAAGWKGAEGDTAQCLREEQPAQTGPAAPPCTLASQATSTKHKATRLSHLWEPSGNANSCCIREESGEKFLLALGQKEFWWKYFFSNREKRGGKKKRSPYSMSVPKINQLEHALIHIKGLWWTPDHLWDCSYAPTLNHHIA